MQIHAHKMCAHLYIKKLSIRLYLVQLQILLLNKTNKMNSVDVDSLLNLNLKQNDKWSELNNKTTCLLQKCAERLRDRKNFVHSIIEVNNEMMKKLKPTLKPTSSPPDELYSEQTGEKSFTSDISIVARSEADEISNAFIQSVMDSTKQLPMSKAIFSSTQANIDHLSKTVIHVKKTQLNNDIKAQSDTTELQEDAVNGDDMIDFDIIPGERTSTQKDEQPTEKECKSIRNSKYLADF